MAPSPMSSDRLRAELLLAREAREAWIAAFLRERCATVIAVSLAIPGPVKSPPGSLALFRWALQRLRVLRAPGAPHREHRDALGPFALMAVDRDAMQVKTHCIALEEGPPAARLLDLDVYTGEGTRIGRRDLDLPPRPCLLCTRPAAACIRLGHHPAERVAHNATIRLSAFAHASRR